MDPLAEFTKLECWDESGKPYLKEVSRVDDQYHLQ
jgi:hypothetical protein